MATTKELTAIVTEMSGEVRWLKASFENMKSRWSRYDNDRQDKMWASVRETIDVFSNKLLQIEKDKLRFGETTQQVSTQVFQLQQYVTARYAEYEQMFNTIAGRLDRIEDRLKKLE